MEIIIRPSVIKGVVQAPASKSSMQRACAAALLTEGKTTILNPGESNDDVAAMNIIQSLGARVERFANGELIITGNGKISGGVEINCGESGLSIRMFTPIAAMGESPVIISGTGSLKNRPMGFFDEVLPKLGVQITSNDGKLPMKIKGPLVPTDLVIDGSMSSQFLTGLLFAYSNSPKKNTRIKVKDLTSKPYIDLTMDVLNRFGMVVENRNYEEFYFPKVEKAKRDVNYTVEGDWSGASFLLVAGAIAGEVEVRGIHNTSTQADKRIVDAILDAGAEMVIAEDRVRVNKKSLQAFEFNATDCPDLFPPLVALAAHCTGVTRIRGLRRLKHKESDRGLTLKEEFDKLGIEIHLNDDVMLIHGTGEVRVQNQRLNSHHDHRIAMACAVACLGADFEVTIRHAEAVDKSYPRFYKDLRKLAN